MERSRLLIETLVAQKITRTGQTYLYRRPTGPRPASREAINRFLHKAAQHFDFGPLMTGDQQQARQVATDYFQHLKREARSKRVPEEELIERLKQTSSHLRRSLLTFFTYLDAQIKTGS